MHASGFMSCLIDTERRKSFLDGECAQANAAPAAFVSNAQVPSKRAEERPSPKCRAFCGRVGHTKARCFKRLKRVDDCTSASGIPSLHCTWIVDSGATHHLCRDRVSFVNYHSCKLDVKCANGSHMLAVGSGDVWVLDLAGKRVFCSCNVFHVPQVFNSIVSVRCLVKSGCKIDYEKDCVHISRPGQFSIAGAWECDASQLCILRYCLSNWR
jgi:hypothetical protein